MGFIAGIRKIQDTLHKCAESIRHAEKRQRHQELPGNQPMEVRAVVSFSDKTVGDAKAENTRTNTTQESIKNATWSAVVAASVYAFIAFLQWCAMYQQTTLLTKQLEGTQGAFVEITNLRDQPSVIPRNRRIEAIVENTGHVIAGQVRAELKITRQTLPQRNALGEPENWTITIGEFAPTAKDGGRVEPRVIRLSEDEVTRINNAKETIRIEGSLFYLNGFGTKEMQPICFSFLPTSPLGSTASEPGPNWQPQLCSLFEANLQERYTRERLIQQEKADKSEKAN